MASVYVSPALVAMLCFFCYIDNLSLFLPFLLSAALHEGGHLLTLRLCHVPIYAMELRLTGAVIHSGSTDRLREAACAAAGPLTNLLLAVCFRRLWPAFCLVNLLLCLYNLLPIYPLDGGRLLRLALLGILGPVAGERLSSALAFLLSLTAAIVGVWLTCVLHMGLQPVLMAALFLCRLPNTPCKIRRKRLQ